MGLSHQGCPDCSHSVREPFEKTMTGNIGSEHGAMLLHTIPTLRLNA